MEAAARDMAEALCEHLVERYLSVVIEPGRNHYARIDECGVQLLKSTLMKVASIGFVVGKGPANVDPGVIVPGVKGRITGQGLSPDEPIDLDLGALIER